MIEKRYNKENTRLGFIGLGLMGAGFLRRLNAEGWNVRGWNRSRAATLPLIEYGFAIEDTLVNLVRGSDVLLYRSRTPVAQADVSGHPQNDRNARQKKRTVKDVQGAMRHSRTATTTDVYMQEIPASVQSTINSINSELRKSETRSRKTPKKSGATGAVVSSRCRPSARVTQNHGREGVLRFRHMLDL